MSVTVTNFLPTTLLNNGSVGLLPRPGSISVAAISGTELSDGLEVNVKQPPQSRNPKWTGQTVNTSADGTLCLAVLRRVLGNDGTPPEEDPVPVAVTVGGVPAPPTTVLVAPAPILLNGSYSVKCAASGTYRWLAVDGSNNVNLANEQDTPPPWTITLIAGNQGDSYTIQTPGGLFLNQASPTSVSLVGAAGPGTSWQLMANPNGTNIGFIGNPDGYLHGDTSNKNVSLVGQPTTDNRTSWTIAT